MNKHPAKGKDKYKYVKSTSYTSDDTIGRIRITWGIDSIDPRFVLSRMETILEEHRGTSAERVIREDIARLREVVK